MLAGLNQIVDETCDDDPTLTLDKWISESMDIQQIILDVDDLIKNTQIGNMSIDLIYDVKDFDILTDD